MNRTFSETVIESIIKGGKHHLRVELLRAYCIVDVSHPYRCFMLAFSLFPKHLFPF